MKQTSSLYDQDFHAWAMQQAKLLKKKAFSELDVDHLWEEVESMGKSEQRELLACFEILFIHLLKWKYQPKMRGASWKLSIEEQRERIQEHLADNPSLKNKVYLNEVMEKAYRHSRTGAARETGLERSHFPLVCEWTMAQVLDDAFFPETKDTY